MTEFSRRAFLQRVFAASAVAGVGCGRTGTHDWLARELVCIHIFNPVESIPPPLLAKTASLPSRSLQQEYFNIGIPELVVCTTRTRFLDMFKYFWPFSRDDFTQLQKSIVIHYHKAVITGARDVEEFSTYLRERKGELKQSGTTAAVVFTYNEFTSFWSSAVITACQQARVEELVLFKDPSRPPYLCDYPAKQKGFKRPPR